MSVISAQNPPMTIATMLVAVVGIGMVVTVLFMVKDTEREESRFLVVSWPCVESRPIVELTESNLRLLVNSRTCVESRRLVELTKRWDVVR